MLRVAAIALLVPAGVAGAQLPVTAPWRPDTLVVGEVSRDRARLAEITGTGPKQLADTADVRDTLGGRLRFALPALRIIRNSDLAYSLNDGVMWAGRGANVLLSGGVVGAWRSSDVAIEASLVPVIAHSPNRPFQTLRGADPERSGFSSPWHAGAESADLPHRFGNDPITTVHLGETGVRLTSRHVSMGAGMLSRWWGPGIRNALLLSSNAAPIPQLYVGTGRPIGTRIGEFTALLMVGTLTESIYFDLSSANDYRALSGFKLEYRPAAVPNLSLGAARLVMSPMEDAFPLGHLLDAIVTWQNPATVTPTSDQLLSAYARWVFPESGFEVYGEWARMQPPTSLRDFLLNSHYTQGYTAGAQWVTPVLEPAHSIRLQAEVTYLEQSDVDGRRAPSFYVGRGTQHGFTHRGQVIGAAIGPGGSSQWVAADFMAPTWQAGAFVGRTRWDNDQMYEREFPNFYKHDVTIQSGLRGAYRHSLGDIDASMTVARRMNYLFQSGFGVPGGYRNVDVQNVTLSLGITPR